MHAVTMGKASRTKASSRRNKLCLKKFILVLRWIIIAGCLIFVAVGWIKSSMKYLSQETSISIVKNESFRFIYPYISLCPKFKKRAHLIKDIIKPAMVEGNLTTFDQLDFDALMDKWAWKREEILQAWGQRVKGNPTQGRHLLYNDSYWIQSIPHVDSSGICFTKIPTFDSKPGKWHGLRTGIQLANSSSLSESQRDELFLDLQIFLHDFGPVFYYRQDNRPSHKRIDMSRVRYMTENEIIMKFKSLTSLDKPERPCTTNPNYDMQKCVEAYFSRERGCQPPWKYYDDLDIPACNDLAFIVEAFSKEDLYYKLPDHTNWDLSKRLGCPMPCTISLWDYDISYKPFKSWMNFMDGDSEWIMYYWFRNFFFQYEKEFLVCDYTCLLGEIGGTLGFFLGGSVLYYIDCLLNPLINNYLK